MIVEHVRAVDVVPGMQVLTSLPEGWVTVLAVADLDPATVLITHEGGLLEVSARRQVICRRYE